MLFIDGNHDADNVLQDFNLYYDKVNIGGIIWFDRHFLGRRRTTCGNTSKN